jgi:hypothetical protein
VADVAGRVASDGAAARRQDGDEQEQGRWGESAAQGYELGWETPSSFETASSRVP